MNSAYIHTCTIMGVIQRNSKLHLVNYSYRQAYNKAYLYIQWISLKNVSFRRYSQVLPLVMSLGKCALHWIGLVGIPLLLKKIFMWHCQYKILLWLYFWSFRSVNLLPFLFPIPFSWRSRIIHETRWGLGYFFFSPLG